MAAHRTPSRTFPTGTRLSNDDKDRFDNIMAIYAAMIDRLDQSVGKLVAGLKERGVLENTAIFIMCDNGGNAESGPRGSSKATIPAAPGPSSSLANAGQRSPTRRSAATNTSPTRAASPRRLSSTGLPASRKLAKVNSRPQPGHLIDIMPTVVAANRCKYPKEFNGHEDPTHGRSEPRSRRSPASRSIAEQPIFFAHEGNRGVRDGKWKLVMKYRGPWELYDMEADRTERNNLVAEHADMASRMIAQWDAWSKRADVDAWTGPARNDFGAPKSAATKTRRRNKNNEPNAATVSATRQSQNPRS